MPALKLSADALQNAIFSIANLLGAGLLTADVFKEMQQLQPKYTDFWKNAAKQASDGQSLSVILRPILDDASHAAIHASENSGTLPEVFTALDLAMEEKRDIRKTLQSMFYPFGMLIAAIGVFIMYLAFIVPSLSQLMPNPGTNKSTLNAIADSLHNFLVTYNMHLGIGIVAIIIFTIYWLRDPNNRNTIVAAIDSLPVLGPAARDLYYGEWANHMAINTHAGVTILDSLHLTLKIMPIYYQPEIRAIAKDAIRLGWAQAATPQQNVNDPRNRVPFLLVNAFRLADKTGDTDIYFQKVGVALITQGKKRVRNFVKTATFITNILVAILGAGAILPYFMQIGDTFSKLH